MMRQSWMTPYLVVVMGAGSGAAFQGVLAPARAAADDQRVYAGHSCLPIKEKQFSFEARYMPAGVESIVPVTFICPLVRSLVTGKLDDVWVQLTNARNGDDGIMCCVRAFSLCGCFQYLECQRANEQEANPKLHFALPDFAEIDSGHYVVTCKVQANDRIRSIRTKEE